MGFEETSCPACGAALRGASKGAACGAAAGLLSLDLPPAGGAAPPPPPPPPAVPAPAPPRKRIPSPHAPGPGHQRAVLVVLPREDRLDLPAHCACCDAKTAAAQVMESRKGDVHGISQTYAVSVPYCSTCRGHLRRPSIRRLVFLLAVPALFFLGWRLHPVPPESALHAAGLALAIVIAARALSYVLVPRYGIGGTHAREGRALRVHRFTATDVTLAVWHAGYRARLGAKPADPRPLFEPGRRLSALLFGGERPLLPLVRPLLTLGAAAALIFHFKPVPEEERAITAFRASPSVAGAVSFAQRFKSSKSLPDIEAYLWERATADSIPAAYQGYLRVFPKGSHRAEAQAALADLEFEALKKTKDRKALMEFVRKNPKSPRAAEARALLFEALMSSAQPSELAPPVPLLRRIWKACPDGQVPVRFEGFTDKDYRGAVEERLTEAFREMGLALKTGDDAALVVVEGSNGLNRSFSYSKFAFAGSGSGPFGEFAQATVTVRAGQAGAAWNRTISVKSPASVSYTTYRFGSGSPIDTGPSQHDVHAQTLTPWKAALAPLFQYR
ncbi:MAG TPA: hypothetical protein VF950_19655 [Planctomycetota bacterium]